jgi:hypothetical protein
MALAPDFAPISIAGNRVPGEQSVGASQTVAPNWNAGGWADNGPGTGGWDPNSAVTTTSPNVVNKTQGPTTGPIQVTTDATSTNPLNNYRSYNYVFTLAALSKNALTDPNSYRDSAEYYVIAKSGGKGSGGLKSPALDITGQNTSSPADNAALVDSFNKNSPGRFDFYLNNVEIETIMSGSEKTSMSVATKIAFEVFEPYSMTGFIEALQVSAVASGRDSYMNCSYLLKMEFIGYPDGEDLPEKAQIVPNSTRYFVFKFTGLDIDVTEQGARYKCTGVPFNEAGFGDPSILKSNIKIKGNTVGAIFKSFQDSLNEMSQSNAGAEKDTNSKNKCDTYEIAPRKVVSGITTEADTMWDDVKVIELLKDSAVYSFPDPGTVGSSTSTTYTLSQTTEASVTFAERANIHECIISIIRDSQYIPQILKDEKLKADAHGMVDYFMVHLETEETGIYDDAHHRPFYHYRYVVIPYKMHYSRLPGTIKNTIDTTGIASRANRRYDYYYTGKNVDIKTFNLKFNTLFFQAMPIALGNKKDLPAVRGSFQSPSYTNPSLISKPQDETQQSNMGTQPIKNYPDFTAVNPKGISNANQPSSDPYAAMAKTMHQAVLDNVDQCTAEIDIIGDPYYLVTGGMGNYKPTTNSDGTAGEGEAPYTTSDVMIVLTFRNPIDIDEVTGEAIFDQKLVPYSGVFRVITVRNEFKDGVFNQRLNLIRLPAQLIDTNVAPKKQAAIADQKDDPANNSTPVPAAIPSTLRADPTSLAASFAKGLPLNGLPGNLSNLVSSGIGSLSGLASSALSGATAAASAAVSWGTTALSAGVPNGGNLAETISAGVPTISSVGSTLGTSQIAAVNSLNSNAAAGLLSGASANIAGLTSNATAVGSQVSGLSSNLTSKVPSQISEALATIPGGVDVNLAVKNGVILTNIPKVNLPNIPTTQPFAIAPPPGVSLTDIKAILDRGGSLANIPGASTIPGVGNLLASYPTPALPSGLGLDASSVAGKLSTVQSGIGGITGQASSIEAGLSNISSYVPSGVPNVSSIDTSVVSKFGSVSSLASSPLSTLMKSVV